MTVELTVLEYITYLGLAFFIGMCTTAGAWVAYNEAKRGIVREARKEAKKQ